MNLKAHHFTKDWKQNIEVARAYLEKASKRMKKWADKRRRDAEFKIGDLMLMKLHPKQFWSLKSRDMRLVRKYGGPVLIIVKVGKTAYKIAPPSWMKVHLVIYVSNLKLYHPDIEDPTGNQPTRPKVNLNRPKKKVAEEILAEREIIVRGHRRKEFLIKWRV